MKLKNGNTLYFAKLDMACNMAGTDFADVLEAKDLKQAEELAFASVCDWIEMYMPIYSGDDGEDFDFEEMEENGEEFMMLSDVDCPEVEEYVPELHDMYMAGGGASFADRWKDQLV